MTEKAKTTEKPEISREEKQARFDRIKERKIEMAKQRGTWVLQTNTPMGLTLCRILNQFDPAYNKTKGLLGEFNGISYEEGGELVKEAQDIALKFSQLTNRLCKRVGFRYIKPRELRNITADVPGTVDTDNMESDLKTGTD